MNGVEVIEFHSTLISHEVSAKCVSYAKEIHAIRLSANLIYKQIKDAIKLSKRRAPVDPEEVFSYVASALENEGISIK